MKPGGSAGPRVVVITDRTQLSPDETLARIDALARAPAIRPAVLLRDPELTGRALHAWGALLRRRTLDAGVSLWVADRLDVAIALEADGVHLGRRSVRVSDARTLVGQSLVSVACHDVGEVVEAAREGADVVVLSPIFASPGKGPPLGVETLTAARRALDEAGLGAELVALGGVDAERVETCLTAGAIGVAAIRARLVSA